MNKLMWSIIFYISAVNTQAFAPSFLENFIYLYRDGRFGFLNGIGRNSENLVNMRKARAKGLLQPLIPKSTPFPCNVTGFRSAKPPVSVNEVRPGDIDIIGALGDSLTAGNGIVATQIYHIGIENRGISWCIGGQGTWREFLTLPNILKEFNPNLFGYSTRDSFSDHYESQFNPAEPGAISSEIPYMAEVLVNRIKSDPRVNLKQHWKLITILIGANDFCLDLCLAKNITIFLEQHRNDVLTTFRYLRDNLPRTIVNFVLPPEVRVIRNLKKKPVNCQFYHRLECYCYHADQYQHRLEEFYKIEDAWKQMDIDVTMMDEFQQTDFAVVTQPFTFHIELPETPDGGQDFTYLSSDCFHLSQKSHALASQSLWNNMLEKIGEKTMTLGYDFLNFKCPTKERPYIFTIGNSN